MWQAVVAGPLLLGVSVLPGAFYFAAQFIAAGVAYFAASAYLGRAPLRRAALQLTCAFAPWTLVLFLVVRDGLVHAAPTALVAPSALVAGALLVRSDIRPALTAALSGLYLVAVAVGGVVGVPNWLVYASNVDVSQAAIGSPAPPLTLIGGDGSITPPEEWAGKTVVLDFWTTECGACYRAFPDLDEFHASFADDPGVEVYAVHLLSRGDRDIGVERFRNGGYSVPLLLADATLGEVSQALGFEGVPAVAVLSGDGTVQYVGYPQKSRSALVENLHRIVAKVRVGEPVRATLLGSR